MIDPKTRLPDGRRPDVLPVEGGIYNAAGLLVGPQRQCHNAHGVPKKQFESLAQAEAWALERGMVRFPYECTFGHVHLSGKPWTRPRILLAPGESK